jgi:formate hydrogenlyase subunit 6/NADH:ubiquinone oxidoreductase subunit I
MFDMITNIIKNFFAGPATRMYPTVVRPPFSDARGQITGIDPELCIYCGICQKKCPAVAIVVDKPTKTWTLDAYKCVICGVCVEACPKKCINMAEKYRTPAYQKVPVSLTQTPKPPVAPATDDTGRDNVLSGTTL